MSQKGKTKIYFLIFFCAVGLSDAFNSVKRSPNGDAHDSAQIQDIEPEVPADGSLKGDIKHPLIDPAHPVVPHRKGIRRVRRAKQRHNRNSRDWQTDAEMSRVFSAPNYQNQQIPVANSRSEVYPQYGYNPYPYGYLQPQLPQQPAGLPYFASSPVSHNTIVPNGPQINNYYHQVSPYQQSQIPPQYSGYQNNYPAPFVSGQFLFIPIPFCYPYIQQQVPTSAPPPDNSDDLNMITMNVTIPNRAGFGEENVKVNPNDYYNTPTGISLQPVRPLRPNSIRPPPAEHKYDDDDEVDVPDNFGNSVSQQASNRPRTTQRPPARPSRPENSLQGLDVPDSSVNRPSSCVWAIVQCCANSSRRDLTNCFERLRCPGAFFDGNPCESQFGKAVSSAASEFQKDGFVLA